MHGPRSSEPGTAPVGCELGSYTQQGNLETWPTPRKAHWSPAPLHECCVSKTQIWSFHSGNSALNAHMRDGVRPTHPVSSAGLSAEPFMWVNAILRTLTCRYYYYATLQISTLGWQRFSDFPR